ncbi:divergent polysaccharide deacetylase family protein [Sneathiella limimaris]|uniref:divergent polysaccharide deacetylase family protein n=1 Tax=Sneathiella limimaris TaxID=1964213 RepID=UPI00146F6771|nr:divergent polysaccharide deacetylase family protein [Sneathiella limimaris]
MSRKNQKKKQEKAESSVFETLFNSPVRLLIFCVAVLMFSLTTGMLIGTLLKDDKENITAESDQPTEVFQPSWTKEKPVGTAEIGDVEKRNSPNNSGSRPIDALNYDPSNPKKVPQYEEPLDQHPQTPSSNKLDLAALSPGEISAPSLSDPSKAWVRYAVPVQLEPNKPLIAIVIDDVGLNTDRVNKLIDLPTPITLSYLPYAHQLDENTKKTRSRGHEVMLHLPMEPSSASVDPGPDALLTELSEEEIRRRTQKNLDSFTGYVGVNNHMGSKFTAYAPGMTIVMDEIAKRGLLFLDSRTTAKSVGYSFAKSRQLPTGNRDVFIDNEINVAKILNQLSKVEKLAAKNGIAIAIGHPYPETIAALSQWMPKVNAAGFQFVPVSTALIYQTALKLN